MDSRWVATLSSVVTAFVVAVTAIAAIRQLKPDRNANDIVVSLRLNERMDSRELLAGRANVALVAERAVRDPECYRSLADQAFLPEELRSVGQLLRFLEHISDLVTKGGIAEHLNLAESADSFSALWDQLCPSIVRRRIAIGRHTRGRSNISPCDRAGTSRAGHCSENTVRSNSIRACARSQRLPSARSGASL